MSKLDIYKIETTSTDLSYKITSKEFFNDLPFRAVFYIKKEDVSPSVDLKKIVSLEVSNENIRIERSVNWLISLYPEDVNQDDVEHHTLEMIIRKGK